MKLLYLANMRLPTEKAHGLQIIQNCEAFANQGAEVTLWAARRVNTPALRAITDVYAHYGVAANFAIWRVPCLDLPWSMPDNHLYARTKFLLQTCTYLLVLVISVLFTRADVYYTRDLPTAFLLSFIKPGRSLAYEPHRLWHSALGRAMQRRVIRHAGLIVPVTPILAERFIQQGAAPEQVHVAHDGFRRARFEGVPDQQAARAALGWPGAAFIVGYVGRLETMSMDKGVGLLVEALREIEGAALALVGGPDDKAETIRRQWREYGLPDSAFLYAGQVAPDRVPLYLSAFDVCAMPFPWTEHFAYYASPIKLFEYMASGRALVASDLPAYADVVTDGEHGLIVPPSDVTALAAALMRLRDDPALRQRIGNAARQRALDHYTWDARAAAILQHMER